MGGFVDRINTNHNGNIAISLDHGHPDRSARCYAFMGTSTGAGAFDYRGVAGSSRRAEHPRLLHVSNADCRLGLQSFLSSRHQRFTSG